MVCNSPPLLSAALVFTILIWVSAAPACDNDANAICVAQSPWNGANVAKVLITQPDNKDYEDLSLEVHDQRNLAIHVKSATGGKLQQGTVMLVNGRLMLTKDLPMEKGFEVDALDGPVLMYKLAFSLIHEAFPAGPAKLSGNKSVDLKEPKRSIGIATNSASGTFGAPWTLRGVLNRKDVETVAFNFEFIFFSGGANHEMRLNGVWRKTTDSPVFNKDMSLKGWSIYTLGVNRWKHGNQTIVDYGAEALTGNFRTLHDLQMIKN
jgi:hypothetical protein